MTVLFSCFFFFFLMIRRPPRSTLSSSSAASDVYKRQVSTQSTGSSRTGMGGMCSSEEERDPCDEESESTPSSTSAPVPEPTELWVTDTELECFDRAPVPREGRMEFLARSEDGRKIMVGRYCAIRDLRFVWACTKEELSSPRGSIPIECIWSCRIEANHQFLTVRSYSGRCFTFAHKTPNEVDIWAHALLEVCPAAEEEQAEALVALDPRMSFEIVEEEAEVSELRVVLDENCDDEIEDGHCTKMPGCDLLPLELPEECWSQLDEAQRQQFLAIARMPPSSERDRALDEWMALLLRLRKWSVEEVKLMFARKFAPKEHDTHYKRPMTIKEKAKTMERLVI
eukprot:TRINITY_DN49482_c0_g1_i2.p1 TRINITY_DN49482_c0_g1~~TRINITY_DN49482_c0_g1_i2.p1  ORF type:complete len:341 (+),score=94.68 TRINITY_DN49482_c0_g1_i2:50-1072(+)